MFKSLTRMKVEQFKASAGSIWGQKDAEKIWKEDSWKLGLKPGELYDLTEGWASYCLTSNASKLEEACNIVLKRVKNKEMT